MADRVQQVLEEMVPELEDLMNRKLFSKEEISSIVKRRTEYEYRLHSRQPILSDFLHYIAYELQLEQLRRSRLSHLSAKARQRGRRAVSEHSANRRIHFIFARATKRFKGDVSLWLRYIRFSRRVGASKHLGKVTARAIQLHPLVPEIWIETATWQYEDMHNIAAARALYRRALRLNKASSTLWVSYFKLEAQYLHKIIQRRTVVGYDDAEDISKYRAGTSVGEKLALLKYLDGDVLRLVSRQAVDAVGEACVGQFLSDIVSFLERFCEKGKDLFDTFSRMKQYLCETYKAECGDLISATSHVDVDLRDLSDAAFIEYGGALLAGIDAVSGSNDHEKVEAYVSALLSRLPGILCLESLSFKCQSLLEMMIRKCNAIETVLEIMSSDSFSDRPMWVLNVGLSLSLEAGKLELSNAIVEQGLQLICSAKLSHGTDELERFASLIMSELLTPHYGESIVQLLRKALADKSFQHTAVAALVHGWENSRLSFYKSCVAYAFDKTYSPATVEDLVTCVLASNLGCVSVGAVRRVFAHASSTEIGRHLDFWRLYLEFEKLNGSSQLVAAVVTSANRVLPTDEAMQLVHSH